MNGLRRTLFHSLKRLLSSNKCALCHQHVPGMRKYVDDHGNQINICPACSTYAERRAYRKVK